MAEEIDAEDVRSFELETWNRCAPGYLDGFAGMTRATLGMVVDAAGVKPEQSVLDIGSGPGHFSNQIRRLGCDVLGVDFSPAMIEVALENYPEIDFRQCDAEQLPFEDDVFDSVISNFVVHHLARPEAVFREISRVLKPAGRFAFTVFADPEAQSSIGAFFAAVEENLTIDELPHGPLFGVTDLELYADLLEKGGLTDPHFEFNEFYWKTDTIDPVINSFWIWGNMDLVPEDIQSLIRSSTAERLEQYNQGEGYAFPHKVLLGIAMKRPQR